MDIRKEREAFQNFCEENFDLERHEQTYFDEQTQCYENDIGEDTESINRAWSAWQAAKAQAVPEWISVQDRMPEQGQKVLVFRPDAHNHPHKDPNFKICTYAGADIFINSHFEHVITHWKPLESPIEAQEPVND